MLNKVRYWRIRKRIRRQIYSIDGIERINQDFLYNLIIEVSKRFSISLYKNVEVSARKKTAYRVRKERKGYFFPYLLLTIEAQKGCCVKETFELKNAQGYWQVIITTVDKDGTIRMNEPQDALIFLGMAKPKE